jgi:maleylpyruvate isomerase
LREIEDTAAWPAAELLTDAPRSAEALRQAWRAMPDGAWDNLIGRPTGLTQAWRGLQARLLEVEVHHVDLAAGFGWRDWPASLADAVLDTAAGRIAAAAGGGQHGRWTVVRADGPGSWTLGSGPERGRVSGAGTAVLAWLLGRADAAVAGLTISGDRSTGAELPRHYPYG